MFAIETARDHQNHTPVVINFETGTDVSSEDNISGRGGARRGSDAN
jgi:hypothetical protein